MAFTKDQVIHQFQQKRNNGMNILGSNAYTNISNTFIESNEVDFYSVFNSDRFQLSEHGSLAGLLPYGDANQIVLDIGKEVLSVYMNTPVFAGVCGTDTFRLMTTHLKKLKNIGFAGIQNFPSVGLIDGMFRDNLEETGIGYTLEIEMIRKANELDMFTCPFVFNEQEAKDMVEVGADCIVIHMGLITQGPLGKKSALSDESYIKKVQKISDVGKSINPDVFVLCDGDSFQGFDYVHYIVSRTENVDGIFG